VARPKTKKRRASPRTGKRTAVDSTTPDVDDFLGDPELAARAQRGERPHAGDDETAPDSDIDRAYGEDPEMRHLHVRRMIAALSHAVSEPDVARSLRRLESRLTHDAVDVGAMCDGRSRPKGIFCAAIEPPSRSTRAALRQLSDLLSAVACAARWALDVGDNGKAARAFLRAGARLSHGYLKSPFGAPHDFRKMLIEQVGALRKEQTPEILRALAIGIELYGFESVRNLRSEVFLGEHALVRRLRLGLADFDFNAAGVTDLDVADAVLRAARVSDDEVDRILYSAERMQRSRERRKERGPHPTARPPTRRPTRSRT